ncbi:kinase-like domain-containing protein [Phaeosphaeriaceae sp. PMI808]|nr:kinase-like domain-containing protein [Phaeosphaeriaceae sp. PMI808]
MDVLIGIGRTSTVYRVAGGRVCKLPHEAPPASFVEEIKNAFHVEKQLLERLRCHPRTIRMNMKDGFLLDEANCGDLQSYINSNEVDNTLRRIWSLQITEAVAYIHKKGIIHMNLSTTNVLVHRDNQTIDLLLADLSGSCCPELGLDGGLSPDFPYYDLKTIEYQSERVDVFSLSVLLYIINTGYFPFCNSLAPQRPTELYRFGLRLQARYKEDGFPDLSNVPFGRVILGFCVERQFETAVDVLVALKTECDAI